MTPDELISNINQTGHARGEGASIGAGTGLRPTPPTQTHPELQGDLPEGTQRTSDYHHGQLWRNITQGGKTTRQALVTPKGNASKQAQAIRKGKTRKEASQESPAGGKWVSYKPHEVN